jgi:hypothetical protein
MPYIARTSSHPSCFELIKTWLDDCRKSHADCRSNADVALPTRIVDVGDNRTQPRLVVAAGKQGQYLTLSYCWGSTSKGITLKANLNDRLNFLSLDSLCQTHRDAIEIAQRLGFRYLWIDALCIIQDDPLDWNRESAKMFSIYRDSVLTIAASHASDGEQGIYSSRPIEVLANTAITIAFRYPDEDSELEEQKRPEKENNQEEKDSPQLGAGIYIPLTPILEVDSETQAERQSPISAEVSILVDQVIESTDGPDSMADTAALVAYVEGYNGPSMLLRQPVLSHHIYSYGFHNDDNVTHFPLQDRAWCFQECILATRLVHFARDELVWECRGATLCECGAMRTEGGTTTRRQFEVSLQARKHRVRSDAWMDLVKKCTQRKIGRESDRLPTLSGLAKSMQYEYGFRDYLAGLWKDFLPDQLLWSTNCGYKAQRARGYRAPTWSFASVERAEYFSNVLETIFQTEREFLVEIVDVECRPATIDPTGVVASGHITITGPIQQSMLEVGPSRDHFDENFVSFVVSAGGKSHEISPDYRILKPVEDVVQECNSLEYGELTPAIASTDKMLPKTNKDKDPQTGNAIPVILLAICNEHRGRTRIGGKGQDTLFCLVLKARNESATTDGTSGVAYERIGLMELDQPDEPQQWLEGARMETVKIL